MNNKLAFDNYSQVDSICFMELEDGKSLIGGIDIKIYEIWGDKS